MKLDDVENEIGVFRAVELSDDDEVIGDILAKRSTLEKLYDDIIENVYFDNYQKVDIQKEVTSKMFEPKSRECSNCDGKADKEGFSGLVYQVEGKLERWKCANCGEWNDV